MDETQNDAPFVAFYDMRAVTFVPPDEMADVTIAGAWQPEFLKESNSFKKF